MENNYLLIFKNANNEYSLGEEPVKITKEASRDRFQMRF